MSSSKVPDGLTVKNSRCIFNGKAAYKEKYAKYRSARWKPDDRGPWSAYKCRFDPSHWHVGHDHSGL